MYNATAYNHAYNDSGIFCIHASADPAALGELVEIIVNEFAIMVGQIGAVELERAKKQLQSMLLMNLEQRPVLFEDIGRQVLSNGKRRNAAYYIDAINKINVEDIHRAAQRMLRTRASIAALGKLVFRRQSTMISNFPVTYWQSNEVFLSARRFVSAGMIEVVAIGQN